MAANTRQTQTSTPPSVFTVGLVQMAVTPDPTENIANALHQMEVAVQRGAEVGQHRHRPVTGAPRACS